MPIYDLSIAIRDGMPGWPGDPSVSISAIQSIEAGATFAVSRLGLNSHTGTHVDAPAHIVPGGKTVDQLPLEALTGPARVVYVPGDGPIGVEALRQATPEPRGHRLLLKTANSDRGVLRAPVFRQDYVALDLAAARWLAANPPLLLGIDALSIEPFGETMGPVHRALLEKSIVVVEGLDLANVPPGSYTLTCLPLRLAGIDGAPARVILTKP